MIVGAAQAAPATAGDVASSELRDGFRSGAFGHSAEFRECEEASRDEQKRARAEECAGISACEHGECDGGDDGCEGGESEAAIWSRTL